MKEMLPIVVALALGLVLSFVVAYLGWIGALIDVILVAMFVVALISRRSSRDRGFR
jgi:ABC-type transport system involved in cytochrome bd biosynthesis fused ATPase/permease subunit